jgi:hypothetical protein
VYSVTVDIGDVTPRRELLNSNGVASVGIEKSLLLGVSDITSKTRRLNPVGINLGAETRLFGNT